MTTITTARGETRTHVADEVVRRGAAHHLIGYSSGSKSGSEPLGGRSGPVEAPGTGGGDERTEVRRVDHQRRGGRPLAVAYRHHTGQIGGDLHARTAGVAVAAPAPHRARQVRHDLSSAIFSMYARESAGGRQAATVPPQIML